MNGENRIRAVEETKRVLKPCGYLFSSFILMFGGVIYMLREGEEAILRPREQPLYEATARGESLAAYRLELARNPKMVRDAWYAYALRFCEKREYLTHSDHLMIVSRKE